MKLFRRGLLEIWAIFVIACVVAFLGPFGTFLMNDFLGRLGNWWALLMGAYVLVRPVVTFCHWIARSTGLPQRSLVFWGIIASSFPMAFIWRTSAPEAMSHLSGYSGLLPFSLLCALAVMGVVWWAERADAHLSEYYHSQTSRAGQAITEAAANPVAIAPPSSVLDRPRLYDRLSPRFNDEIIALESEDHYVRVHGMRHSELLFMRLRDAIMAMDNCPGEQTHRSWWVARKAVAANVVNGRKFEVRLANGMSVPVTRDSLDRLQESGFLPAPTRVSA